MQCQCRRALARQRDYDYDDEATRATVPVQPRKQMVRARHGSARPDDWQRMRRPAGGLLCWTCIARRALAGAGGKAVSRRGVAALALAPNTVRPLSPCTGLLRRPGTQTAARKGQSCLWRSARSVECAALLRCQHAASAQTHRFIHSRAPPPTTGASSLVRQRKDGEGRSAPARGGAKARPCRVCATLPTHRAAGAPTPLAHLHAARTACPLERETSARQGSTALQVRRRGREIA
jgi:hypothetical protein